MKGGSASGREGLGRGEGGKSLDLPSSKMACKVYAEIQRGRGKETDKGAELLNLKFLRNHISLQVKVSKVVMYHICKSMSS